MSRYQKGKRNLDFTEARDSEWQWHQLGHMQVCTSLQTDNHACTPPLSFFTGRMPFLPPNQQRQSTEGTSVNLYFINSLALEMASPGNRHCANCIGALSFPITTRKRKQKPFSTERRGPSPTVREGSLFSSVPFSSVRLFHTGTFLQPKIVASAPGRADNVM